MKKYTRSFVERKGTAYKNYDNGGVDEGGVAPSSRTVKDNLVLVRNLRFVYPFLLSEMVVE
jgi:hypothetical protein